MDPDQIEIQSSLKAIFFLEVQIPDLLSNKIRFGSSFLDDRIQDRVGSIKKKKSLGSGPIFSEGVGSCPQPISAALPTRPTHKEVVIPRFDVL